MPQEIFQQEETRDLFGTQSPEYASTLPPEIIEQSGSGYILEVFILGITWVAQLASWLLLPTFIIWITLFFVRKDLHKKALFVLLAEAGVLVGSVAISASLSYFLL